MLFAIDLPSFLLGLLTASLFWWLVSKSRPILAEARTSLRERGEAAQARKGSSVEENFRRVTLRRAQGMHLAAPLFALDEILQPPLLIAPQPQTVPGDPPPTQDAVSEALPYLPTWPELAAAYHAQALSLPQALAGGRNLVITGQAGAGKTVALAYLASLASNRSELLGELQNHLPFLVHVADLRLPITDTRHILDPVVEVADATAPVMDLGRIPAFVEQSFRSGRALLLLDGFDELPVQDQKAVCDYLKLLLEAHPRTRVVTTGTFESLGGLLSLNFAPLSIMAWNRQRVEDFLKSWGRLWSQYVTLEAWTQSGPEPVDPLLLNHWLAGASIIPDPLECTLMAWAAYAGDGLGPHIVDAISTHIRRLAPPNTPLAALDTLALQVVVSSQPVFEARKAGEWVSKFETAEPGLSEEAANEENPESPGSGRTVKARKGPKTAAIQAPSQNLLSRMTGSGLLVSHPSSRLRFVHPVFEGFLAGRALNDYSGSEGVLNQPDWIGKVLTLRYLAASGDITPVIDQMLEWSRLPMHRPLLTAARWLRDAPREAPWRSKVMSALVQLLQTEGLPLSLRGQAAAAIALSNDAGAAALFRNLMNTLSFELVQLCALGSGFLRDAKATKNLENVLSAPSLTARQAACLALVAIGSDESMDAVGKSLLHGDESIQRSAAEALANDPDEGFSMLKDGATIADILVRRAVVYGLVRVEEPWALELLRRLQIDDDQWVVRNAAGEALDDESRLRSRIPHGLPAPSETPWLLEFAASQGVGIPPGSPATELLISALNSQKTEARLASIPYLKRTPSEGVVTRLYHVMYSQEPQLREAIYIALMEIAASGIKLPHPTQFGIA